MRFLRLLPFMLFTLLAVLFGFVLVAGNSTSSPLLQKPLPHFALNIYQQQGQVLTHTTVKKPAILVFWASWCGVCKIDLPILSRFAKDNGIPLYGIAYRDTVPMLDKAVNDLGKDIVFTSLAIDYSGETSSRFGLIGVPTMFVTDKNGTVIYAKAGSISQKELHDEILPLLR